jgi:ATP-binding cassette subfamily B protein
VDSLNRFFTTYTQILKLAWQVHPGLLILLVVSNIGWGLTNLPLLYINKALIDLVISSIGSPNLQNAFGSLALLIAARTLVEATRNILSRIQNHNYNSFASLMSDRITVILGNKLNSLDVTTIESAEFEDKFNKIERQSHQRIWGMVSTLSEFPNAISTIFSSIIPLLQFNPLISVLVFIISIPDIVVNAKLAKYEYIQRESRNRLYRSLGWLSWIITDTRQFFENKILGNVNYVSKKMIAMQDEIYQKDASWRTKRTIWRTLADIPWWLLSAVMNIYFFAKAILGEITLGSAQLLYQSSQTFAGGIGMFMNNISTIYEHYLFVNDFTWFIGLQPRVAAGTLSFPEKINTGIEFRDVWFKYPNSDTWIIKNLSFKIEKSENLAIVGENGAGKTTLLKLLLGFYPPTKGQISIDGIAIQEFSPASYWSHISALQQNFHLFPFSARESIAFSNLDKIDDIEAIKAAAQKANIDDYLSSLPKGYDTPMVKQLDGVDPSGGQSQRIAIARALFKKSQIMILDEPTSNIDPKAEEEIFKNIIDITRNQILILVSHRFSTVRRADKILVLDDGQLVEFGTHNQLMKNKHIYKKLFTLQAKSYQ